MQFATLKVRLPSDVKNWLAARATENGRSLNAEAVHVLRTVMADDPLYCVVRCCRLDGEEFFTAAIGESADDFYEGSSKEQAFAAARAKLKSLGFERPMIEYREELIGNYA